MLIASYNVNGLRAAMKKGFLQWANQCQAQVICLQEIRAKVEQIDTHSLKEAGWFCEFFPADKAGYAGTGILSRQKLSEVRRGGFACGENEGRVISGILDGARIYSVYAPSGSSGGERQKFKMEWLKNFKTFCQAEMSASQGKNLIFCGDFNICHQSLDIHDPKGLAGASGFLPEERGWFSEWLELGLSDSFRVLNPSLIQYSWWSMRSRAKEKNLGWRIDYIIACHGSMAAIRRAWIDQGVTCSDHCPVLVDFGDRD
jgi:exodeoxyribonuclease-3